MHFDDLSHWKSYTVDHWQSLHEEAVKLPLQNAYEQYLALILLPLISEDSDTLDNVIRFLDRVGITTAKRLLEVADSSATINVVDLVNQLLQNGSSNWQLLQLRNLFFQGQALAGASHDEIFDIVIGFLRDSSTSLQVSVELITSENDVIIAGRDVYKSDSNSKQPLKRYLSDVRAQWNHLDFSTITSDPTQHIQTRLHQLYTPLDLWNISPFDIEKASELVGLRQRAVEQELLGFRRSIVNAANDAPHLVIVGGPGTGKSTLCGFLAIGLAYTCDTESEQQDGIIGSHLLGNAWTQGPHLPIYVRLRHFAQDKKHFPRTLSDARCTHLISYLKHTITDFDDHLMTYLEKSNNHIQGALLILDGLDEIYNIRERRRAKKVIDHFAESYPHCRILVTCRSAVYRQNSLWALSDRFSVMELAPYSWAQVSQYIRNWYTSAAENRPISLGGKEVATTRARQYAADLVHTLRSNTNLWSIARQPLLLALLVLIHEENQHLPQNRAELYEKTVHLLHRWNPPDEHDPLSIRLHHLNYRRVRNVLQLTAFNAQRDCIRYKDNEASIQRRELLDQLVDDGDQEHWLGADIKDVLEYLATRNGILVADFKKSYRFLHLTIQEYLAACALIEQYDEVTMPKSLVSRKTVWTFPENICHLLSEDAYRWREVALFCGLILGNDLGQDRLWAYLETLLPDEESSMDNDGSIYRIAIAAEVWSDNRMRIRLPSHRLIQNRLRQCIESIDSDDRLDVPEHARVNAILQQITSIP